MLHFIDINALIIALMILVTVRFVAISWINNRYRLIAEEYRDISYIEQNSLKKRLDMEDKEILIVSKRIAQRLKMMSPKIYEDNKDINLKFSNHNDT